MPGLAGTATAFPNIALIKYWGNRDPELRLPANGSISMNLGGLTTRTQVTFDSALTEDRLTLNDEQVSGPALRRVSDFLERVRRMADLKLFAAVDSHNNFPMGAGIASSASAFAALSLAASRAAGLELDERGLSRLARSGSGSACRSVPGGFVEWQAGDDDESSYAFSIAPASYWALCDCIAIISRQHKPTGSTEGHALADTSPLQAIRAATSPQRLEQCRRAILQRDFQSLAQVVELDCHLMHAAMMTSAPPLIYWLPATLAVIEAVLDLRKSGLPACYTIDAGPNVHVLCPAENAGQVSSLLGQIPGVEGVLTAYPGEAAFLEE